MTITKLTRCSIKLSYTSPGSCAGTGLHVAVKQRCAYPTMAMNHRKEMLAEMPVAELLKITTENLLFVVEQSIAHLCSKHPKPGVMGYQVMEIPVGRRRNKLIRYGFWPPIGAEDFLCYK